MIHKLICFADDLLLRWKIDHLDHVSQAVHEIGITLDVLEKHQLVYNPKKTVVLFRLEGLQAARTAQKWLIRTHEGLRIKIPRAQGDTLLPVVHTHKYLGCKLSYHAFETATISHRLHVGRTAFIRLRPWLVKRHSVPLKTKAQVWRACILSSYLHGLSAAGLTQAGLHKLIRRCNSDLRLIGQSPGHLTHETNADLFHRLGVLDPLRHLQEQWTKSFARLHRTQAALTDTDFLKLLPIATVQARVMSVFEQAQAHIPLWDLPCPYCAQTFAHMSLLNKHMVVTHKAIRVHHPFDLMRDALQGRPQCRHCFFKFSDWRGLRVHITAGSCPWFDPDLQIQEPPADQAIFRDHVKAEAWMAMLEQPELVRALREHCVLCGRYFFTGKVMLEHLNLNHYEMWLESKTKAPIIINALRDAKPCQACGKKIDKAHACHVIRQMAILQVMCATERRAEDLMQGKPQAPAPPKPAETWQLPKTGQRIRATPPAAKSFRTTNAFNPGRDSADGTSTCAHCQCVQGSHFALRRRIETGCCKAYNPNRPLGDHIPQTWPDLMHLAKLSETDNILSKPEYIQALRTTCVLCGRQSAKPGAIIQHHLQDHAALVQAASAQSQSLQNQAIAAGRPCFCGNRTYRKGHQCVVFSQIALLHVVAHQEVEAPVPAAFSSASATLPLRQDPTEIDEYWADHTLRTSLNTQCKICAISLTLPDVESHLMTSHATLVTKALDLYPTCVSTRLDCCRHCLESEGIEEFCPAALQLAFHCANREIVTAPPAARHGHLRDTGGRHDASSPRRLWGDLQQYFQVQPQTRQTRGLADGNDGCHGEASKSDRPPHGHLVEARIPITSSSIRGPVPDVLPDESEWHPPSFDGYYNEMEEGNGASQDHEALESGTISAGMPIPARQDADLCETLSSQHGMGECGQGSDHHTGWQVAIPSMEQRDEEPSTHLQASHRYGQTPETPGGPSGSINGGSTHLEIQVVEEHIDRGQASTDLPLSVAPVHSGIHHLGHPEPPGAQFGLVGASSAGETTYPEGESLGHFLSQVVQAGRQDVKWPVQQEEVKGTLQALRLINPDNLCFVHATMLAFFWGFIHLKHCKWADLGGAAELLIELCGRSSLWVEVSELECWKAPWIDGRQHDAHEFLKAFLAFFRPPALTGSWTRRMCHQEQISIMDRGSAYMPPALATSAPASQKVTLQSLIDEWHDYVGMITAFEHDSPLLCFQIDRFRPDTQGNVEKAGWTLELTNVNVLISSEAHSLVTEAYEYTPVAGLVHRGQDQFGHLQCVGKTTQGWVVFDDNIESCHHATSQPPRLTDWIRVWLIRCPRFCSITPSFYVRDHDAKVVQLVNLLKTCSWQAMEAKEELMRYFAVHCGACAQVFLSTKALVRHVFLRHFQARWTMTRTKEWIGLDHRFAESPCLFCGAVPVIQGNLGHLPTHSCPTILNFSVAKDYYEHELKHRSTIYGAPRNREGFPMDLTRKLLLAAWKSGFSLSRTIACLLRTALLLTALQMTGRPDLVLRNHKF